MVVSGWWLKGLGFRVQGLGIRTLSPKPYFNVLRIFPQERIESRGKDVRHEMENWNHGRP